MVEAETGTVPQPYEDQPESVAPFTVTFPVAINAVERITVKSADLELKRVLPPALEVNIPHVPCEVLPDGLPPPPPPSLPAPGNLHVAITFREQLGKGRSGLVYAVDVSPDVGLPPLVAKVARIGHQSSLIREAAVYERLECIQGLVVPLFYGTFEGHLEDGHELDVDQDLMKYEEDPEMLEKLEEYTPGCEQWVALERRRRDAEQSGWICISLLERLGKDHIPLGQRLPSTLTDDIWEDYEDITAMCVIHEDIRYANILSAGPSTCDAVCPWHGHAHRYLILDFEDAQLWAGADSYLNRAWGKGFLGAILHQLPHGSIWERWHF
ncbi:hypothetical protein PLICRDRAFT_25360 [Plicaturopsis crispa FD-325 SS-3]|nr:hypothetical protein PLICRDRAFT_25360 [Plicaturopsis crispa FD-325 SS-3]